MGAPILNTSSVIICPHGGMVQHVPAGYTAYRVDGRPPMLYGDTFLVAGCSNMMFGAPSPCMTVTWAAPSVMLIVMGRPALTFSSIALCTAVNGVVTGPGVITYSQLSQLEPDELTVIDY
jgi:hypothetical protein